MNVALPRSLNVDQYLAWAERQEQGKYELIDGVVSSNRRLGATRR
jgi:hypothetical protein